MLILPFATHPQILSAAFMKYKQWLQDWSQLQAEVWLSLPPSLEVMWELLAAQLLHCGLCHRPPHTLRQPSIPELQLALSCFSSHSTSEEELNCRWNLKLGQKGYSWFSHSLKYHYFRLWSGGSVGFSGQHQAHKQTQPWWKMTA